MFPHQPLVLTVEVKIKNKCLPCYCETSKLSTLKTSFVRKPKEAFVTLTSTTSWLWWILATKKRALNRLTETCIRMSLLINLWFASQLSELCFYRNEWTLSDQSESISQQPCSIICSITVYLRQYGLMWLCKKRIRMAKIVESTHTLISHRDFFCVVGCGVMPHVSNCLSSLYHAGLGWDVGNLEARSMVSCF